MSDAGKQQQLGIQQAVVLPLLQSLDAMGRAGEAAAFRREFEALEWHLTQGHVKKVLAALSTAPSPPLADESAPELTITPSPYRPYQPFVDSLPGKMALVDAVEALLLAQSWDEVLAATRELFCEQLGYDSDPVVLTPRLLGKSAIQDLVRLGSFHSFRVLAVRLTRSLSDTRYSSTSAHYKPCFQLEPNAIIVSYEPGAGAIRLVYRQHHGRTEANSRYLPLVCPWYLRDPNENTLTLCHRFGRIQPSLDDDVPTYARRVQEVLDTPVGALARSWPSAPIHGSSFPVGTAFRESAVRLMDSFVQNDGRWWGLQAVLGNLFPIFLKWGECWLDCAGFEVVGEPLSADECWRERGTRELRVRLRLRVCDWDDLLPLSEVNLETALPVPDERGWFWIDGEAYRYLPTVGADGRLLGRVSAPDWLDDQDEQEEVDAEEDSAEQDDASVEDERSTDTAEGAAIDALFSRAIERRLWYRIRSLRKSVQSNRWDEITADVVRAEWLAPLPPGEPYRLLSHGVFAVLLHPIDIERPAVELTDVVSEVGVCLKEPPSWACPDLSAQLMPGRWAAISSARLHPTGALAVPVSENGAVRLRATRRGAFHHNPRLGAVAPGPSTWWIHPLLISHAHLEPGVLQAPARVAGEGARLDLLAVAHPDAKAMLRPGCCSSTILRTKIDIPFNGRGAPPVILVAGGDELDEGRPWIQIPWELLGEDIEPSRLCERCEEVLGDDGRPGHLVYLPWDTRVRVQASGLSPVYRVGVQIGWRAFLEVETLTAAQPELLSEAGVLHSVHEWAPEDMPYDENGAIAEAVVPGVQGNDFWFDGATGQALQATTSGEITVVAPSVGSRDKGSPGAVDLLPRPGVLSCGEGWATTRLRILAGLAGPDWKERLLRAHQNHDLVRWCARVPGTTFSGLVEDVAKVPSITRPNSIPMLLSESGVDCLCTCGLLQGTAFLGARCNQCDSLVEVRSVEHTRRRVTLPVPAIHPWAKEIAGALLGLVPDELEVLLLEHGPTRVIRACHQVLHIPTVNASRRVALDNDHPRALRGQQRRRLGQVAGLLRPRTKEEMEKAIELHWVGVPTPDLVQPGVALDQLKPGGSDLLARFARLHGACWSVGVAADIGLEALEITAEVQLQQAVDQVFGAPHQGEVDTLAGLWRATSVWMRPDRPSVVPHYGDEAPFPSDAQWWSKRAARTELVEKYSVPLISLVSAVPGWPVSRCEEAVEQLARILLDDTSDLRSLLEIVARKLMVQLPSAHDEAEEGLRSRLGLSPNGAAGEALVRCLSGWWFGDSTAEVPSGMLWLPPDESPPSGYRRRVPPLDHSAWRDWSGRTALPDLGLALLGVPQVYDLPLALPIEQDPEIGEPDWGVRWEADEDLRSIPASPIELPRATPQREIEMEQDDIPTEEVEAGGVDEIVALDLTIAQWMERL